MENFCLQLSNHLLQVINPADLLKTHITGVINHGFNEFTTFLDYGQYPHDPNLVLNVLLRTLLRTASKQVSRDTYIYMHFVFY